jgi:transcriptional regulator with GAF, ATPase, and Fis domain
VRAVRKALGGAPLVALVGRVRVDTVVTLLRAGVVDAIGLPAPAADVVARAVLHSTPQRDAGELIGQSPAVVRLRREIAAVSRLRSTVLITGETGTGKGVVARQLHRLSPFADRPFVHVDCAALASNVIETELFGNERGAYTGAVASRAGRFELAGSGTIFLDEIGDLEPSVQVKLLRVLQDREYERVGSSTTRVAAARVIAATNRDLRAAVASGTFRADLYFRLAVFHLHVPPLRERPGDATLLARSGVERIAERLSVSAPQLSDEFYAQLEACPWPGNVRELMNAVERALVHHQMGLDVELDAPTAAVDLDTCAIREALLAAGGNISRAARRLGIARSTLRYRVERAGLAELIPKD